MLLARLEPQPAIDGNPQPDEFVWLTFRTKVLASLAALCIVCAVVLWLADLMTPGWALFGLGQDLIVGGIGVLTGERSAKPRAG